MDLTMATRVQITEARGLSNKKSRWTTSQFFVVLTDHYLGGAVNLCIRNGSKAQLKTQVLSVRLN